MIDIDMDMEGQDTKTGVRPASGNIHPPAREGDATLGERPDQRFEVVGDKLSTELRQVTERSGGARIFTRRELEIADVRILKRVREGFLKPLDEDCPERPPRSPGVIVDILLEDIESAPERALALTKFLSDPEGAEFVGPEVRYAERDDEVYFEPSLERLPRVAEVVPVLGKGLGYLKFDALKLCFEGLRLLAEGDAETDPAVRPASRYLIAFLSASGEIHDRSLLLTLIENLTGGEEDFVLMVNLFVHEDREVRSLAARRAYRLFFGAARSPAAPERDETGEA